MSFLVLFLAYFLSVPFLVMFWFFVQYGLFFQPLVSLPLLFFLLFFVLL